MLRMAFAAVLMAVSAFFVATSSIDHHEVVTFTPIVSDIQYEPIDAILSPEKRLLNAESAFPVVNNTDSGRPHALNKYCVLPAETLSENNSVEIVCTNNANSTLDVSTETGFFPTTYFQQDNGTMSAALEEAISLAKARYANASHLHLLVKVDGYHPQSESSGSYKIVALLEISQRLTSRLGAEDKLDMTIKNAGLRIDPTFSPDRFRLLLEQQVVVRK